MRVLELLVLWNSDQLNSLIFLSNKTCRIIKKSYRSGMIFLLPTDTCYWLAWEFNEQDYNEIYRLKWRDFSKRLAVLVCDMNSLRQMTEISEEQINLLEQYPSAWSIILPKRENYDLPRFLNKEEYSNISFRVAEKCISAEIRNQLSYPLFLTSANLSGKSESTTLAEAREYFPWIDGYDGGVCDQSPSDIFSFWANNELIYIRRIEQ